MNLIDECDIAIVMGEENERENKDGIQVQGISDIDKSDVAQEIFETNPGSMNEKWSNPTDETKEQQHEVQSGDKLFICSYCNKAFKRKDNLQRHERNHTGDKPFSCLHCNRKFTNSRYSNHTI